MKRTARVALILWALVAVSGCNAAPIPKHPSELQFPPLTFTPPEPSQYRVQLENGMVVYFAEDASLPRFQMSMEWPGGGFYEPEGKDGVAALTYRMLRGGGTDRMAPAELDARLEQLAASISTFEGNRTVGGSCWCLSKDTDEVLGLLKEVLLRPGFDEKILKLSRQTTLRGLAHRYDTAAGIVNLKERQLLYGDTLQGRTLKASGVQALTREDMQAFAKRFPGADKVIVTASGAFDRGKLLSFLTHLFDGVATTPFTPLERDLRTELPGAGAPGVYVFNKPNPQASVSISHLGIERHHPDVIPLRVMSYILGGWMGSRITKRVRVDEGLAYDAGGYVETPIGYRGQIGADMGCKTEEVGFGVSIILEELERIRKEPVTDVELSAAKSRMIEAFPSAFSTPWQIVANFTALERDEIEMDWYAKYRERVAAVTKEDILRVAKAHIQPEKLVILAGGDAKAILAGNPARKVKLEDLGKVQVIEPGDAAEGE